MIVMDCLLYVKKKSEESGEHRLLHCEIVYNLWGVFFSWVGLAWLMPRRVVDLLRTAKGHWRNSKPFFIITILMWTVSIDFNGKNLHDFFVSISSSQ